MPNKPVIPTDNILPKHVAIIMDGNGRWAQARNRPRAFGHREGVNSTREIVRSSVEFGLKALTMFAFSSENWQRPAKEVGLLMALLEKSLKKERKELNENNIVVRFIGDVSQFSPQLRKQIALTEETTKKNTGMYLTIALNYGGHWDIAQATRQIAEKIESGLLTSSQISVELMAEHMCLSDLPALDLFIRTGGDCRVSNYLLWQLAYSELYFTDTYWPDFRREELQDALSDFSNRQRRFGLTGEQVAL